ncbi:MAG: PEGA domain-containing protein [Candidatus Neomarinimicrobiota bacterium]
MQNCALGLFFNGLKISICSRLTLVIIVLFSVLPLYAQPKTTLAVLDLDAKGLAKNEVEILTDRLRSNTVNLGIYDIVERQKMQEILDEQQFQLSGCTSDACAVQVGQLLGVQKMITGSVGAFGKVFTVELRLLDVESGKIERSANYDFQGELELLLMEGMNNALLKLLGLLDMPTSTSVSIYNKTGVLVLNSIPESAEILIDGKSSGTTPSKIEGVPAGLRTVVLRKADFQPFTTFINILADKENPLSVTLKSQYARVQITVNEPQAEIYLNNSLLGKGNWSEAKVNPGNYILDVKHWRYLPYKETIRLNPDDSFQKTVNLEPRLGYLKVDLTPGDARLLIKGQDFQFEGKPSALQIGEYQITARKPYCHPTTQKFKITENTVTEINFNLVDGRKDYQRIASKRNLSTAASIGTWCFTGASALMSEWYYSKYCDGRTVNDVEKYRDRTVLFNNLAKGGLVVSVGFSGFSIYEFFHLNSLGKILGVRP